MIPETDIELANKLIAMAREDWLENNPPHEEGIDVVTPYDEWFYKVRG